MTVQNTQIKEIEVSRLRPHPDNSKIYGSENVQDLAEQIRESGWIKPLVVTQENIIVSGHRRYAAALLLELDVLPCEVVHFDHEWQVMERLLLENEYREKTPVQRIEEFEMWKRVEADKARGRMESGVNQYSPVEIFPHPDKGKARDFAAEKSGFGTGRTAEKGAKALAKAKELKESGQEAKADLITAALNDDNFTAALDIAAIIDNVDDEQAKQAAEKIKSGKDSATKVKRVLTQGVSRRVLSDSLEMQEIKAGPKKYRIVYADPPWQYGNDFTQAIPGSRPQDYYSTMPLSDICAMPVRDLCEENAVLFLWGTSPLLPEALEVIKAWGFKYKTTFVWDKVKHNFGHYNSVRHEFLFIATRGSCTPDNLKLFDSVQVHERTEHSRKPEAFREIIETLYTHGNKIELFARTAPDGWDVFGNQVNAPAHDVVL